MRGAATYSEHIFSTNKLCPYILSPSTLKSLEYRSNFSNIFNREHENLENNIRIIKMGPIAYARGVATKFFRRWSQIANVDDIANECASNSYTVLTILPDIFL